MHSPFKVFTWNPCEAEADGRICASHAIILVFGVGIAHFFCVCYAHVVLVAGVLHAGAIFSVSPSFPFLGGSFPHYNSPL